MQVAVTGQTLWVLVVASAAQVTLPSSKIGRAVALSTGVTRGRGTSSQRAVAGHAVRVVVEATDALVATWTSESFAAQTGSSLLVTDLVQGASNVAVAI